MKILFIMGFPNVGKSMIISILEKYGFQVPLHITNRPKREKDTFYYHISTEEFKKIDMFISAEDKFGRMYGVSKNELNLLRNKYILLNCSIKNLKDIISIKKYSDYDFQVCMILSKYPIHQVSCDKYKYNEEEKKYRINEVLFEESIIETYDSHILGNPNFVKYYIEDFCDIESIAENILYRFNLPMSNI